MSLCVLVLLLERAAEIRTGDTWRNLRVQLQTIKIVEYRWGSARFVQTTDLRPEVVRLLGKLAVALANRDSVPRIFQSLVLLFCSC